MRRLWITALVAGAITEVSLAEIVTGTDSGVPPHVKAFSDLAGTETASFFAYPVAFTGGVRVAAGDVNGDGRPDIITGGGVADSGHVKAFDGVTSSEIRSFLAYGAFSGGIYVGAGDVNHDSVADIITGIDTGAAPQVKVFNGTTSAEIRSFFAYDSLFTGGVRVASGDFNHDGFADIITGAGAGGLGHVKVFDGNTGSEIKSFLAYGGGYSGGIFVAGGDVNHDSVADIITGTDSGFAPHVKVFDGASGAEIRSFFAYDPGFTGGVRVASGDVNGDGFADIITGEGDAGSGHVKVFDGATGAELGGFLAYGDVYSGGIFVASDVPETTPAAWIFLALSILAVGRYAYRRQHL
jgi:hypothetical protein